MTDRHTLLVSYRSERGEPRGPIRKGANGLVDWSSRGDCIDCNACVAVCPTGIDIRDGSQLECIQCALCIDACNEIMRKIGRPTGLIAYDTVAKQEAKAAGAAHEPVKLIRARTLLYAGALLLVALVMLGAWLSRSILELNVIRDRNPPFVRLSNGSVRNGFTVKILNKLHEPREFTLSARDLPGAQLSVLGIESPDPRILVPTDVLREMRVFVTIPPEEADRIDANHSFHFVVRDTRSGEEVLRSTTFHGPGVTLEKTR
jgi:cytochrome c oxidase accessory protein FixG